VTAGPESIQIGDQANFRVADIDDFRAQLSYQKGEGAMFLNIFKLYELNASAILYQIGFSAGLVHSEEHVLEVNLIGVQKKGGRVGFISEAITASFPFYLNSLEADVLFLRFRNVALLNADVLEHLVALDRERGIVPVDDQLRVQLASWTIDRQAGQEILDLLKICLRRT
jgi:hypothetical protein